MRRRGMTDMLEVTARLLKSESADWNSNTKSAVQGDATLLAAGSTSQVFTTPAGELLLNWPPFMLELLKTWEPLWKQP